MPPIPKAPAQTRVTGQHPDGTDCHHDGPDPAYNDPPRCPGRRFHWAACKGKTCGMHYRGHASAVKAWKRMHRQAHLNGPAEVPPPRHTATLTHHTAAGESAVLFPFYSAECACGRRTTTRGDTRSDLKQTQEAITAHLGECTGSFLPWHGQITEA